MLKSWKCAQSVKSALLKSNLNDQQLKIMLGCDNVMTGRDVAGLQDAEKITITLQMEGKSICVESVETGPASRTVRCEEERWYHPHSANYFHVIIIAIIDMFLSSLQSVKIFSSSIYVSNELSTIRKQLFWMSSQRRGLTRTRGILAWCLMTWKFLSKWVWIFLFHSHCKLCLMWLNWN